MRLAIVGTGPTGIYTLQNLIQAAEPLEIVLYEKGDRVGVGMPYSPETASKTMLANIASIEIPPLDETYLAWMQRQDHGYFRGFALDPRQLDARSFTPRLMLGDYFHDQVTALIAKARADGHSITVYENCEVTDLVMTRGRVEITSVPAQPEAGFDRVILATGHVFAQDDDPTDHYFPNPWSGLITADIPAARIGIMGTSLSAIDAAMAVASQHGAFRRKGEDLTYHTEVGEQLQLTLMSWTGILPETDFYCPIPYTPLVVMTPAALAKAMRQEAKFEAVFALFCEEIAVADPDWAQSIGLAQLSPEAFERAYFHDRAVHDAFQWARQNLEEAEANKTARKTVAWRYAILRMHEQVEGVLPEMSEAEKARFDQSLKKVFVDNYAAVPPESIRRLLALRDAGVLRLLALGDDYELDHGDGQSTILAHGRRYVFDIFIDARGQKPMATADLPFSHLRDALLAAKIAEPEIGEDYGLISGTEYDGHLYLAALPYVMGDHPFVQGITACAEIGTLIAQAEVEQTKVPRHRRRKRVA